MRKRAYPGWQMAPARRIRRYVERWNKRNPNLHGPTIREVARALRMPQEDVELYLADDPDLMMVGGFLNGPRGDWMIEIIGDTRDTR